MTCIKKIAANILNNCDNAPIKGLEEIAIVLNYDDVDKSGSSFDATLTNQISTIGRVTTTQGYKVEGEKVTNKSKVEAVVKEMTANRFKHSYMGKAYGVNAAVLGELMAINKGKFIVVIEKLNKGVAGDGAFQVLGWDNGLTVSEMIADSEENEGMTTFTLDSAEGMEETGNGLVFFDTDYDTTKAAFDALLVAAT